MPLTDTPDRDDDEFQIVRARTDLEFARTLARAQGRTRAAVECRRIGMESIPVILERIELLGG